MLVRDELTFVRATRRRGGRGERHAPAPVRTDVFQQEPGWITTPTNRFRAGLRKESREERGGRREFTGGDGAAPGCNYSFSRAKYLLLSPELWHWRSEANYKPRPPPPAAADHWRLAHNLMLTMTSALKSASYPPPPEFLTLTSC